MKIAPLKGDDYLYKKYIIPIICSVLLFGCSKPATQESTSTTVVPENIMQTATVSSDDNPLRIHMSANEVLDTDSEYVKALKTLDDYVMKYTSAQYNQSTTKSGQEFTMKILTSCTLHKHKNLYVMDNSRQEYLVNSEDDTLKELINDLNLYRDNMPKKYYMLLDMSDTSDVRGTVYTTMYNNNVKMTLEDTSLSDIGFLYYTWHIPDNIQDMGNGVLIANEDGAQYTYVFDETTKELQSLHVSTATEEAALDCDFTRQYNIEPIKQIPQDLYENAIDYNKLMESMGQ